MQAWGPEFIHVQSQVHWHICEPGGSGTDGLNQDSLIINTHPSPSERDPVLKGLGVGTGAGEMVQQLKAVTALRKSLGLVPNTHIGSSDLLVT